MHKSYLYIFVLGLFITNNSLAQSTITATLDFSDTHSISPLIYGYNQDHEAVTGVENWATRRLGGNRLTVFNWENGASNAGHDNPMYPNDNRIPSLVGVSWVDKDKAGEAYRVFHQDNLDAGLTSIVTVPIQGWVAADKNGSNLTSPPSLRWDSLVLEKPTPFSLVPDLSDGIVYMDESINYLVQIFGDASTSTGVKYIVLDNEPAYWDDTHDLIQLSLPNAADYTARVIAAAKAVKAVDPNVKTILGEFGGINIYDFGNAPDWASVGAGYDWFISYFLDELKMASDVVGYPLVDIISFHNYPQHKVDVNGDFSSTGTVVRTSNSTADHIRTARMSFPRSLWDATHIEASWLTNAKLGGQPIKKLLRLKSSIDTYFPDLKIMIGEYDYGHDVDISHGIGISDFLGVVANQDVEIVNRWDLQPYNTNTYTSTAYQLFRNYDGANSTYGDVSIGSTFDNADKASVWASIDSDDGDLHLILINKELTANVDMNVSLNDAAHLHAFENLSILNTQSTNITQGNATYYSIDNGVLSATLPPLTAYHLVLSRTSDPCFPAPSLELAIKAFLQGNFDISSQLMSDDLRANTLLPMLDPYGLGKQIENATILTPSGNDAIVDWVKLELRPTNALHTITQTTAALLQRDGDIVDVDGVSAVSFCGLPAGDYQVVVRDRNHLGIMANIVLTVD